MNVLIQKYFNGIEFRILNSPVVESYEVLRKEISDADGKIRIRIALRNR